MDKDKIKNKIKDKIIDFDKFSTGLRLLEDTTKAPFGSARVMNNILISDRGGISKRPGTTLLGSLNNSTKPTKGFYVYKKSFGSQEIPIKTYHDEMEYYHPTLLAWHRLEDGFTDGSEFGFKEHLVNIENEDYLYFCNRTEDYRRWSGAVTQLNGALSGGETTVVVDSTLKSEVFDSRTASANSATTLDINFAAWAADQWINFYVYITSGVHSGKIRKITDNTTTQITFDTLGSGPGNCTFEIRMPAFPASGTLVINGEYLAYSAIPTATSFTTSSAPAAADNSPVTLKPSSYPANPRGNRLETHFTRMIVGNVRSALSRDSSGNVQGSQSTGSYYVSKLKNATDFTFSATRVAGEGDIVSTPYGGGDIVDIANQEGEFYIFKNDYIEAAQYTQDSNDLITRRQLRTGIGAQGRVIKGSDDIYFATLDNKITSIGRVENKDATEQTLNLGLSIKRLIDGFDFSAHSGIRFKQRIFHNCKASTSDTYNNRMIVFNEQTKSYEGLWTLGAFGFGIYGSDLYYADARTPNVYKMFDGYSDTVGDDTFAINSEWKSNFMNLTASKFNQQSVYAYAVEGYIWGGTNITLELYKDFSESASLSFTFGANETEFMDAVNLGSFLGDNPLGLDPLGTLGEIESDGSRHFSFIVYFPYLYGNYFSVGVLNAEKDARFDITRLGLAVAEDTTFAQTRIKTT